MTEEQRCCARCSGARRPAPALGGKLLPDVDWSATALGPRAITVTAAIAALAGLLSALPPAIHASRRTVRDALRSSAAGGITRSTARVLVLLQATLSVLLLAGAALFVRSLGHARNADLGFEPRGVLVAEPTFAEGSITAPERAAFFEGAAGRLQRVPRIEVAAASATAPFDLPSLRRVPSVPTQRETEMVPRAESARSTLRRTGTFTARIAS